MIRIFASLVLATAPVLATAESLDTFAFTLEVPTGWEIDKSGTFPPGPDDPYTLIYEDGRAVATISAYAHSRSDFKDLAYFILDARLTAERELAAEVGREIALEHTVTQHLIGHEFSYVGSDTTGRFFRSWGMVREARVINVYVESYELSEESLQEVTEHLLAALRF